MTLIPSLTFTDYEWFPWSICNGCGMPAGNAYPSGHLVPSPILGLANAPIVETKFLELAMSLLDFSPRIPLGTFSILLPLKNVRLRSSTNFPDNQLILCKSVPDFTKCRSIVEEALQSYCKRWCKKENVRVHVLNDWKNEFLRIIDIRIE